MHEQQVLFVVVSRVKYYLRAARFSIASVAELDLDYLERRGENTITYEGAEEGSKEEDSPADTLDCVKIIFLGAPGVGKTSIIRVRFFNRFSQLDVTSLYTLRVIALRPANLPTDLTEILNAQLKILKIRLP